MFVDTHSSPPFSGALGGQRICPLLTWSPAQPAPAGRHEVRAPLPAPPPCLCLFLPVGSAGLWREGGQLFAFRPWVTSTSQLSLPLKTQPAAPAMDRWYLGECPEPRPPTSPSWILTQCPPHHFQEHPQLPRSIGKAAMGEARFLNEGISFWGPGRAVLSAPSISELSRAGKATRPTALIPSVICRNSEARLLGSELGSPTSHLPDLWEVI